MPGAVVILDSVSSLCTAERAAADVTARFRDDAPLLLASFTKRIGQAVAVNKSVVILISHLIANQGMGFSPWTESGGNKIKFLSNIRLKVQFHKSWVENENIIGQEVNWIAEKTCIKGPGSKCVSYLRYGEGIDVHKELIDLASDIAIIKRTKNGVYQFQYDGQDISLRGGEAMRNWMKDTSGAYDYFNKKVVEAYH